MNTNFRTLSKQEKRNRLKEIAAVFLRLGTLAFGGPAAHIAMMDEEIVKKRKWLEREKFLDLLGATNLIPGPNSTELAIHLGFERGGIAGLFIAGVSFILPAMLIVLAIAVAYVKYGALPQLSGILYGIKPVIMAILTQALYRFAQTIIKRRLAAVLVVGVMALSFAGLAEIPLLLLAGLLMMVIKNRKKLTGKLFSLTFLPFTLLPAEGKRLSDSLPLHSLFLIFLKIGSVLYGSGYVLMAFLESELVEKLGILTNNQLLDAVAVGQFTPGPVFTTATFIGYLISGFPGALLATIGIFLPAFVLVWLLNPLIPKLRASTWFSGILDGVNAASLALMAVVSIKLGIASIIDVTTILLFAAVLFILIKTKLNSAWLIVAGGVIGWLYQLIF